MGQKEKIKLDVVWSPWLNDATYGQANMTKLIRTVQ